MSDLSTVLGSLVSALFLLARAFIYVTLIRQIAARRSTINAESAKTFDWPEAILAAALVSFLLLNALGAASQNPVRLSSRDLAANFLFTFVVVFFIAAFLKLRRWDLNSLGAFSAMSFRRALSMDIVPLFAASPLIALADSI